jgi:hypothetical protein
MMGSAALEGNAKAIDVLGAQAGHMGQHVKVFNTFF